VIVGSIPTCRLSRRKTLNPSAISRWREYLESQTIGSAAATSGENAMYWVIQIALAKLEVCAGDEPMNE
jgi:hypothetical protein